MCQPSCSFSTPSHGALTLVGSQTITDVQALDPLDTLLVEDLRSGRSVEIKVSSENLIGTFSGQDHLDSAGLDLSAAGWSGVAEEDEQGRKGKVRVSQPRVKYEGGPLSTSPPCSYSPEQVHGQRGSDGGDIIRLERMDTLGEGIEAAKDQRQSKRKKRQKNTHASASTSSKLKLMLDLPATHASCVVNTYSACLVPKKLAAFLAANKSGDPSNPIAYECKAPPDQLMGGFGSNPEAARSPAPPTGVSDPLVTPADWIFFCLASSAACCSFAILFISLAAIEATKEESNPPESNTPNGTSLINLFLTAFSNDSLKAVKSASPCGISSFLPESPFHQSGSKYRVVSPVLESYT